jgi:hypothetical protein
VTCLHKLWHDRGQTIPYVRRQRRGRPRFDDRNSTSLARLGLSPQRTTMQPTREPQSRMAMAMMAPWDSLGGVGSINYGVASTFNR